jgi:hypothetical protein
VHLTDSKPLGITKSKRASWSSFLEANKGFPTVGMVSGFKLHAFTTLNGLFDRWAFAPANASYGFRSIPYHREKASVIFHSAASGSLFSLVPLGLIHFCKRINRNWYQT